MTTKEKITYQIVTRYKIFELRDGLIKEPKEYDLRYKTRECMFDEYETEDQAKDAILKKDSSFGDYLILQVADKSPKCAD